MPAAGRGGTETDTTGGSVSRIIIIRMCQWLLSSCFGLKLTITSLECLQSTIDINTHHRCVSGIAACIVSIHIVQHAVARVCLITTLLRHHPITMTHTSARDVLTQCSLAHPCTSSDRQLMMAAFISGERERKREKNG